MSLKKNIIVLLFFSFIFNKVAISKTVKLEWKSVESAVSYHLKIEKNSQVVLEKTIDRTHWKGELESGTYYYQIRGIDQLKRPGQWTDPSHLVVLPSAPVTQYPSDGESIQFYNPKALITLKWEPIEGIHRYKVEILKKDKVVSQSVVDHTHWTPPLLASGEYFWRVKGILEEKNSKNRSIASRSSETKTWDTSFSDTQDFEIQYQKLDAPQMIYPVGLLYPPQSKQTTFKWSPVSGAEAYEVQIVKAPQAGRSIASVLEKARRFRVKQTETNIPTPHHGNYLWSVRAIANVDENKVAQAFGQESQAQFTFDPSEAFQAKTGYVAFSTMIAPYSYEINNPSSGFRGKTDASAIVFRGSGEYWFHPVWGVDLGIDTAQLQINGVSTSRLNIESHIKYRFKLSSGENGWFLSPKFGFELRDYNELNPSDLQNPQSGTPYFSKITPLGLSAGFDLRKQFGSKWSLGAKFNYFFPVLSLGGLPDGGSFSGSASYRNISIGIQGLYWFSSKFGLALGGYLDDRSIGFNRQGSVETIYMDGLYFYGSVIYRFW